MSLTIPDLLQIFVGICLGDVGIFGMYKTGRKNTEEEKLEADREYDRHKRKRSFQTSWSNLI